MVWHHRLPCRGTCFSETDKHGWVPVGVAYQLFAALSWLINHQLINSPQCPTSDLTAVFMHLKHKQTDKTENTKKLSEILMLNTDVLIKAACIKYKNLNLKYSSAVKVLLQINPVK